MSHPLPGPLEQAIQNPRQEVHLCAGQEGVQVQREASNCSGTAYTLAPIYPEWLGDRAFSHAHNVRFAYVVGEMARGIATPQMVIAAAQAGLLGFYGSAGLQADEIRAGLTKIKSALDPKGLSYGANVIHTPQQPGYEAAIIDLFLDMGVRRVSASAFMRLSKEIVRYSAVGLSQTESGQIQRANHVFAKVSRAEVARQFMAPAPAKILSALVAEGRITQAQADLAAKVPVAADITAESDSGGHTDNRPASTVFSSIAQARADTAKAHGIDPDTIELNTVRRVSASAFMRLSKEIVRYSAVGLRQTDSGQIQRANHVFAKVSRAEVARQFMAPAPAKILSALVAEGLNTLDMIEKQRLQ